MPDILIRGMEMPPENTFDIVYIYSDGSIAIPTWGKGVAKVDNLQAIELPPHGDLISLEDALIDADERAYDFWTSDDEANGTKQFLMAQPVVVPAERRDYP